MFRPPIRTGVRFPADAGGHCDRVSPGAAAGRLQEAAGNARGHKGIGNMRDARLTRVRNFTLALWLSAAFAAQASPPSWAPPVFPLPQEIELLPEPFRLGEDAAILVPEHPSANDWKLARFLVAELSDRYQVAVPVRRAARLPAGEAVIVMGSIDNPLVREWLRREAIALDPASPGPEGYVLQVSRRGVLVAGSDEAGAFYGLQSLRQLIRQGPGGVQVQGARIRDWPHKGFRGIRLYLPGRENLTFFRRFLRDFMALYKYNRLIVEVNAAMRLDRHPELNAGWIEFANSLNYTRRSRARGPGMQAQDSAHHDTADGRVLEKEEVSALVDYARSLYIDVIPEIPTLTHSYYLLTRHRELAEIPNAEWPDTYCTRHPKTYDLVFDVFDEYIEVMRPKIVSIGHDEYRIPVDICPRCRNADRGEIFGKDVKTLHDYLAAKGIRTAMWGDHLIERNRGKGLREWTSPTGYTYYAPGALTPAQVEKWIPKDVLIFNWFWQEGGRHNRGEINEIDFANWGFEQIYANFLPDVRDYARRSARPSILGGAPSSWAATTELNFGKDLMYPFLGCANRLWSKHWPETERMYRIAQALMPAVYRNLRARPLPSEDGDPVVPLDISGRFTAAPAGFDLESLRSGALEVGRKLFQLGSAGGSPGLVVVPSGEAKGGGAPASGQGIPVGLDPSSLIFLHAAARPAQNDFAYRQIFNFADTADLLGWYEVVYEDGFLLSIPIRYGVNILEWGWLRTPPPRSLAYQAELADVAKPGRGPVSFFAFEWKNPRFGKVIREVRLMGAAGFRRYDGSPSPANAVLLAAISYVKARKAPPVAAPLTAKTGRR